MMHGEASDLATVRDDFLSASVDSIVVTSANRKSPVLKSPIDNDQQDEGHEPLSYMAREIVQELAADAVLIAWHEPSEAPMCLFFDGKIGAERLLLDRVNSELPGGRSAELYWLPSSGFASESLTTAIPSKGGVVTITATFRYLSGSCRMRTRSAMQRLIPIIQPFFRMWALRLQSRKIELSLAAAIDHSHVATVLVDTHGELLFVNEAASKLIAQGEGLRRTGKHLAGEQLSDTLRLQASIEHALSDTNPGSSTPVVALKRQNKRALFAAVVAHRSPLACGRESEAIIYIFDPEQDLDNIAEPVCKHYGLSPVETKLACLLVGGASLSDAARHMRVREQTARTYLKQLFSKTDTKRQAEFVLLMLKSSVRLLSRSRLSFF